MVRRECYEILKEAKTKNWTPMPETKAFMPTFAGESERQIGGRVAQGEFVLEGRERPNGLSTVYRARLTRRDDALKPTPTPQDRQHIVLRGWGALPSAFSTTALSTATERGGGVEGS